MLAYHRMAKSVKTLAAKHGVNVGRYGVGNGAKSGHYYISEGGKHVEMSHAKTAASGVAMIKRYLRGTRKMNPKKKRSAKQLANDKRLGAMAKKRAKKKRAKKTTARKRNPKGAAFSTFRVFRCKGFDIWFYTLRAGKPGWTLTRNDGILFYTKSQAAETARYAAKRDNAREKWQYGVSPASWDVDDIARECNAGK